MTWESKPVWTEGMFLRPQHFQQFERFIGAQLEGRVGALSSHGWGLAELRLDEGKLRTGKIAVAKAAGVFDDGTPFRVPDGASLPPLEVSKDMRDTIVHLCLPIARAGAADVTSEPSPGTETRYAMQEFEAVDSVHGMTSRAPLNVGQLKISLRPTSEKLDGYSTIPLVRVIERRPDDTVVLDKRFIPSVLSCRVSSTLERFLSDLEGQFHSRGQTIAELLSTPDAKSRAGITDFLMLMLVNRGEAAVTHLASLPIVHPTDFYRLLVELAAELATITAPGNRPVPMPLYDHRDLRTCFEPVMQELQRSLERGPDLPVVPIPLVPGGPLGSRIGHLDGSLFGHASFVLAARAATNIEALRAHLPRITTIAAADRIEHRVRHLLSGIDIHPLASEPRQIPFRANSVYFSINTHHDEWSYVEASGAIALHVGETNKLPELQVEMWAIREAS